jgi:hypothetical protein
MGFPLVERLWKSEFKSREQSAGCTMLKQRVVRACSFDWRDSLCVFADGHNARATSNAKTSVNQTRFFVRTLRILRDALRGD